MTNAPVATNSAAIIARIGTDRLHPDFGNPATVHVRVQSGSNQQDGDGNTVFFGYGISPTVAADQFTYSFAVPPSPTSPQVPANPPGGSVSPMPLVGPSPATAPPSTSPPPRGSRRPDGFALNGDGIADLIVAAGFGGGPRVAAFDGRTLSTPSPLKLFADFLVFEEGLRNGVYVAAGDLDGDGSAELIVGGGPGGGPRISAFAGKSLVARNARERFVDFLAGAESDRSGVRVTATDLNGDGTSDVVAGGSSVRGFDGAALLRGDSSAGEYSLDGAGGVFVG